MTTMFDKLPPSDIVELSRDDGSNQATVHLFGATILSWKCSGKEVLFLSDQAVFDNKKAIRGGIPLVFPCFGPWDKGPQHGFARIKRWQLESPPKDENGHMTCQLCLCDDEDTRKMWSYSFKLLYTIELGPTSLSMRLTVSNTGNEEFDFTTLMHTYFRTPDISHASVSGLEQISYVDKVDGGKEKLEEREYVHIPENYDRVYKGCPSEIIVKGLMDGHSDVSIKRHNLPDIVVWNPWEEKAKAMSDFGDEEYKHMLCVEGGFVSKPMTVEPQSSVEFSQTLSKL